MRWGEREGGKTSKWEPACLPAFCRARKGEGMRWVIGYYPVGRRGMRCACFSTTASCCWLAGFLLVSHCIGTG
jgi:hypothetical protein